MKIEHIAIWVNDLEKMKAFYESYFDAISGDLYHNEQKNFKSYFLSFADGCRLEIMYKPTIPQSKNSHIEESIGFIHFAMSVGSKEMVDQLTDRLKSDGYTIVGLPRTTGDGYYESVILDPENNRIEITV